MCNSEVNERLWVAPGAQTSLHAKCLVVDRLFALVSSANFTERCLTRNIEAGILVEDPTFARRLSEQWLALVDSGQMKPYRPAARRPDLANPL